MFLELLQACKAYFLYFWSSCRLARLTFCTFGALAGLQGSLFVLLELLQACKAHFLYFWGSCRLARLTFCTFGALAGLQGSLAKVDERQLLIASGVTEQLQWKLNSLKEVRETLRSMLSKIKSRTFTKDNANRRQNVKLAWMLCWDAAYLMQRYFGRRKKITRKRKTKQKKEKREMLWRKHSHYYAFCVHSSWMPRHRHG